MGRTTDHALRVALVAIREIAMAQALSPERVLPIIEEALATEVLPSPFRADAPRTGAARQAAYRARRRVTVEVTTGDAKGDGGDVTGDATGDVTGDAKGDVTCPPGPPRDSLSRSHDFPKDRESETRQRASRVTSPVTSLVTRRVTSPVTQKVTEVTERVTGSLTERYVAVTDVIPPELRESAAIAGVKDIAGAWAKFTGHYAGKWVHVQGRWQVWCVNEAKRERVDLERRLQDRPGDAPDYVDPQSAEASQRRRRRDEADLAAEVQRRLAKAGGGSG